MDDTHHMTLHRTPPSFQCIIVIYIPYNFLYWQNVLNYF
uniref:Uncharacterized protein n=1 Tax=Anguilla anguilla TaxID=7936 RepID=A0A0E9P898_ANGAN